MTPDKLTDQFRHFKSLDSLYRYFTTERVSREWLTRVLYPNGVICPYCGEIIVYSCSNGTHHCDNCNRTFSIKVGTIFQGSKLPLRKWFAAIWLTINNKKGISACMLSREINVSYTTAWHMLHKLRRLVPQPEAKLRGEIQVDCGYIGGLLRWTGGYHDPHNYLRNKVALLGLASKDEYRIQTIEASNWRNISRIIDSYCSPDNCIEDSQDEHRNCVIYTDFGKEFNAINRELHIPHYTTCHETHHWKDPQTGATTSKIESAWSHIRRHQRGIYHVLPQKRAQRYIDEFVYRYNTLKMSRIERAQDFFSRIFVTITWREIALTI